ncbi:malonyl CoA-ACP transacylase [Acrocarpospora phusangensis]|uniref:Malonyl CoA-ACP transacylase n=1 Tax=Acrocarpospora phusangensis TaxID=1070424 RepID=A0A919QC25_9ACTN|nr:malonyl CoA-ACP transacylase [Acrocarpospora phusangensis]GIH26444.1 malonyl CoA-ACP transacylase [Acrocarpospora phusangensis]
MIAALVGGTPITVETVERRVRRLRRGPRGELLPADGTAEGRQLRRWVTQILVAEQVVADEAARRGIVPGGPPLELTPTDRLELGSVMAAVLSGNPLAQALYRALTATQTIPETEISQYFANNQDRYRGISYEQAAPGIRATLLGARRRRQFALWADARCARATLLPGFEHPGDIRHPDHTHRH